MAINLDKLVGFHESALTIRTERMEVIAGNLANANTPGYKARDIDFNKAAVQPIMLLQEWYGQIVAT